MAIVSNWTPLGRRACENVPPSREEALAILRAPDAELMPILQAAFLPRERFYGRRVRVHVLENAKSGLCPEDCGFCSQSSIATGPVPKYRLLSKDQLVEGALRAKEMSAVKYCIVTSTRTPSEAELGTICAAVEEIKRRIDIKICCSLGGLTDEKARRLKAAGVDRFNHNLETAERLFPEICTTHTFQDRVNTVRTAKRAGMDACCGGILGMGERPEDVVDLAFALRELDVESIPVNFLNPRPGTPLAGREPLTPESALKALALFRLVNPAKDLRAAGGREVTLREKQPLALYAANSIFANGYLTTPGQGWAADRRMIAEAGFEIDGEANRPAPAVQGTGANK